MLKLRFPTQSRTSLGCIIAPVGTQSPTTKNQNPAEGRYCTLKSWTNTIMNRSGAPADCWLLCMIHASHILNHLSCEALDDNVPLGCFMVSLQTSASFSYRLSINLCFMPPTTNHTPLLVRKELHNGLAWRTCR